MHKEIEISRLCCGVEHWRNVEIYGADWENNILYFKFINDADFFCADMSKLEIDSTTEWQHIKLAMDRAMSVMFVNNTFQCDELFEYIRKMIKEPYDYDTYVEIDNYSAHRCSEEEENILSNLYNDVK